MRSIYTAILVLSLGGAACQLLVGIGERDEGEFPRDAAVADGEALGQVTDANVTDADTGTPLTRRCGIGLAACGGACVDLSNNRDHCGECGHGCLTAMCLQRECVPELVPSTSNGPVVLVANGELFFRDVTDLVDGGVGTLRAVSLDGGAERDVLAVGVFLGMVPLGGTRWLLFEEFASMPRLRIVDLATGAVERTLYASYESQQIRGAAVHGQDVYFTTRKHVRHVRLDGTGLGVVRTISEGLHGATPAIDFTSDHVYFGIEDRPTLNQMTRATKPVSTVLDQAGAVGGEAGYINVDPTSHVLTWLVAGQVRELPLDGGSPTSYPSGAGEVHSFAREGSFLYVSTLGSDNSRLVRIDLRSRSTLVLGSAIKRTGQIALDERYVYTATYDGGIYRVAR